MGSKELPKPRAANSSQVGRASWHRGGFCGVVLPRAGSRHAKGGVWVVNPPAT